MGNFRSYFRPDMTPEKNRYGFFVHGASVQNQEMRKTHNRRQRAYNKDLVREAIYGSDDDEAEDAEDSQPHRGGVAVSPPPAEGGP